MHSGHQARQSSNYRVSMQRPTVNGLKLNSIKNHTQRGPWLLIFSKRGKRERRGRLLQSLGDLSYCWTAYLKECLRLKPMLALLSKSHRTLGCKETWSSIVPPFCFTDEESHPKKDSDLSMVRQFVSMQQSRTGTQVKTKPTHTDNTPNFIYILNAVKLFSPKDRASYSFIPSLNIYHCSHFCSDFSD